MKILVTGGSGFIGMNLVEKLISNNYDLKNLDIKPPSITRHIKYWNKCDLLDKEKTSNIILSYNPDFIFHLAAKTDLDGKKISDYSINYDGTKNLIDISRDVKKLKFIFFFSTMLVSDLSNKENLLNYSAKTIYGKSKVLCEKIIIKSKLNNYAIIRPTSIWGPWFGEPYKPFFNLVIKGLFFGISSKKPGIKTFGYVGNLVLMLEKLLIRKNYMSINKKIFYFGDSYMNINNFATLISNNKLVKRKLIKLPFIIFLILSKIGDFLKIYNINFPMTSFRLNNIMSNNKIKDDFIYDHFKKNKTSLDNAISNTIKFLKNESS